MVIRRASSTESDEIAAVWLWSRRASAPVIPPPVHTDEEVRDWFRDVVLATRDVWVACEREQIVGLLVLDDDWVDQLYVAPMWTGRGVGSRLLDVAKAARPSGLQLWTFQANVGARRFYERHGFLVQEETDGANEEGMPDVRYRWSGVAPVGTT